MKTKTLRLCLTVLSFLAPGCACFTSPDIQCWYPRATEGRTVLEPGFGLMGRTGKFWNDVYGPTFQTPGELAGFVTAHDLKICGSDVEKIR